MTTCPECLALSPFTCIAHPRVKASAPDPYFATAIRSDGAWVALAGPYGTLAEAVAARDMAKADAFAGRDPRSAWFSYGCIRSNRALEPVFGKISVVVTDEHREEAIALEALGTTTDPKDQAPR